MKTDSKALLDRRTKIELKIQSVSKGRPSENDGRILKGFEKLYKALHIAGYYRGLLEDVDMVKDAFKAAKEFIEKIVSI